MNNRELAILLWLGVFAAWALTQRNVRSVFAGVVWSFVQPKIVVPLWLMAIWVGLQVWLGSLAGIWTSSLLKDTAIWFVTSGLVLFFNFDDASKDPNFFRRKVVAALIPVALLEVLLDIFVLPLIPELILQPVLVTLAMLAAVAKTAERYNRTGNVVTGALLLITLLLFARAALKLISDWSDLDKGDLLLQMVLPAWLTIGLLPFIHVLALYAACELAFMRVNWKSTAGRFARLGKNLALVSVLHVNAHAIGAFAGPWPYRLAEASSFSEARKIVKDFQDSRREATRSAP